MKNLTCIHKSDAHPKASLEISAKRMDVITPSIAFTIIPLRAANWMKRLPAWLTRRCWITLTSLAFESLYNLIRQAEQTLNGYMNYVRRQRAGSQEYGDKKIHEDQSDYETEQSVIEDENKKE